MFRLALIHRCVIREAPKSLGEKMTMGVDVIGHVEKTSYSYQQQDLRYFVGCLRSEGRRNGTIYRTR